MRLLVINPNTTELMRQQIDEGARKYASPGTEIVTLCAASGPRSIEGEYDVALSAVGTLQTLVANEKDYDGFVVACGQDPGLYACREVTTKPVVGIGEASMYMACLLGHRFTSMTALWRMVPLMVTMVRRYGLTDRCASVRAAGVKVIDIAADRGRTVEAFIKEARVAIDKDGADVICLSGAAMVGMDKIMEKELGVPVTDGVVSAVKLVEAQVAYGLHTSKKNTFAFPERKDAVNVGEVLRSVYE